MAASRTDAMSLPRPLTSLIGREQELEHLYELLRSEITLVNITGFGGIGKTRLSLQAALELEPIFDAGALFAPLASVTQGSSIPKAIAISAGLDELIDSVTSLAEALGTSSRLLVLDNLEQIPDAAEMVLTFLQTMPNLTILATSRNRLEISGEYVVPLEPLETRSSNPESLPSVQLFIERAQAADSSFASDGSSIDVIAEICQKLDGIPLAIELAAARLAIFSLTDLRDQLENILPVLASKRVDLPDRQRTMRNAIAWTYELLDESERKLFTWLSVYEQDFSLESVTHVAHKLELIDDPLDLVQFLVSRSLIRPARRESATPRYQMLQMLREFGHEMLIATGENSLARRSHAADMVALAERAEPHLRSSEMRYWYRVLNDDMPNIRSSIQWARTNDQEEVVLQYIKSLWRFLNTQGHTAEFLDYLPAFDQLDLDQETLARTLIGIGSLQTFGGQDTSARESFQHVLEVAETLANDTLRMQAYFGLGQVEVNDHGKVAIQHLRKALEIAESIGDAANRLRGLAFLGTVHAVTGSTDKAIPLLKKAIDLAIEQDDTITQSQMTGNLGVALQYEQRYEESDTYFWQALRLSEQAGDEHTAARIWTTLSMNRYLQRDYARAREYAGQGLQLARKTRMGDILVNGTQTLIALDLQQQAWGAAAQKIIASLDLLAEGLPGPQHHINASIVAEILLKTRSYAEAAEIMGAILTQRSEFGLQPPIWRKDAEEQMQKHLKAMKDPAINGASARGAQMDLDTLVRAYRDYAEKILATYPSDAPETIQLPEKESPVHQLTPREIEVVNMAARGFTNAEIADEMFVSTRTVTTHLTNIFTKLDVKNRSRAVAVATEAGLV